MDTFGLKADQQTGQVDLRLRCQIHIDSWILNEAN